MLGWVFEMLANAFQQYNPALPDRSPTARDDVSCHAMHALIQYKAPWKDTRVFRPAANKTVDADGGVGRPPVGLFPLALF
jgi:hypothetical protein